MVNDNSDARSILTIFEIYHENNPKNKYKDTECNRNNLFLTQKKKSRIVLLYIETMADWESEDSVMEDGNSSDIDIESNDRDRCDMYFRRLMEMHAHSFFNYIIGQSITFTQDIREYHRLVEELKAAIYSYLRSLSLTDLDDHDSEQWQNRDNINEKLVSLSTILYQLAIPEGSSNSATVHPSLVNRRTIIAGNVWDRMRTVVDSMPCYRGESYEEIIMDYFERQDAPLPPEDTIDIIIESEMSEFTIDNYLDSALIPLLDQRASLRNGDAIAEDVALNISESVTRNALEEVKVFFFMKMFSIERRQMWNRVIPVSLPAPPYYPGWLRNVMMERGRNFLNRLPVSSSTIEDIIYWKMMHARNLERSLRMYSETPTRSYLESWRTILMQAGDAFLHFGEATIRAAVPEMFNPNSVIPQEVEQLRYSDVEKLGADIRNYLVHTGFHEAAIQNRSTAVVEGLLSSIRIQRRAHTLQEILTRIYVDLVVDKLPTRVVEENDPAANRLRYVGDALEQIYERMERVAKLAINKIIFEDILLAVVLSQQSGQESSGHERRVFPATLDRTGETEERTEAADSQSPLPSTTPGGYNPRKGKWPANN